MNLKKIKDAARQAFSDQQSQDTEGGVPDAVSFIAGFLAGARHVIGKAPTLKDEYIGVRDTNENLIGKRKVYSKVIAQNKNCYIINHNLVFAIPFYYIMQVETKDLPEVE